MQYGGMGEVGDHYRENGCEYDSQKQRVDPFFVRQAGPGNLIVAFVECLM